MLEMPRYWNSKYYDRDTNTLDDRAPDSLKNEWDSYNRVESMDKENYTVY